MIRISLTITRHKKLYFFLGRLAFLAPPPPHFGIFAPPPSRKVKKNAQENLARPGIEPAT